MAFDPGSDCIGFYRFEDGALTVDSSDGGNTLSTNGTPAADTVNFKEGAASAILDRDNIDLFYRNDADLSADWPGKGGAAYTALSVCACFRLDNQHSSDYVIASKKSTYYGSKGWRLRLYATNKQVIWAGEHNPNGIWNVVWPTTYPTDGKWYFVAATVKQEGTVKTATLHVWDYEAGTTLGGQANQSEQDDDANNLGANTYPFAIGGNAVNPWGNTYNGNLDAVLVYKKALSQAEMDQIRADIIKGDNVNAVLFGTVF